MATTNKERYKKYYDNHSQQEIERYRKYYFENKEKLIEQRKERYKNDPVYKFKMKKYSINKEAHKNPNLEQIKAMKHALGWDNKNIKNGKFKPYRNYYYSPLSGDAWENWTKLAYGDFAKLYRHNEDGAYFAVTTEGIKYLEELFNITIIQDEEDIVEA